MQQIPDKPILFPEPSKGQITRTIYAAKRGRCACFATEWPAEFHEPSCQEPMLPGQSVTVVGRRGLTLLVKPLAQSSL